MSYHLIVGWRAKQLPKHAIQIPAVDRVQISLRFSGKRQSGLRIISFQSSFSTSELRTEYKPKVAGIRRNFDSFFTQCFRPLGLRPTLRLKSEKIFALRLSIGFGCWALSRSLADANSLS